jgi:hypothetical protein
MTIILTIEIEGGNLGPFDLYSNTDGYTDPFATNITKAALEAGYTSTSVPPDTTTVQVKSVGNCSNSIDIVLENTTTTSTTTTVPGVPCNGTSDSGGAGLKDLNVNLDPAGGVITFLFDPQGAADKMEFYHGLPQDYGINKVATTSQSASEDFGGNYGPFDDEYGTPPAPIIFPNNPTTDVDQFIGTFKGTVPTRQAEYTSDTGCTIPSMTIGSVTYDQVVWWRYDAADYLANPVVTVRVTGSGDNTLWNSIRICNVCTTTTTTSSSTSTSTTTTTTTAGPITYTIGQAALGGTIAYINGGGSTGTSGLVATVADVATDVIWGCQGTVISGADGTAIGTGQQNTTEILAGCTVRPIAASVAAAVTDGGYNDWYLPSQDELIALWVNRVAIGGFSTSNYWSSTESSYGSDIFGIYVTFTHGGPIYNLKSIAAYVRAVRFF